MVKKSAADYKRTATLLVSMQAGFKERLRVAARARGMSPGDFLVRGMAPVIGLDPEDAVSVKKDRRRAGCLD